MKLIQLRTMLPGFLCVIALAGCSVTTHDKGNGKKDDVDIKTPFGSLSVKEGASDVKDTGLSPYPGARVAKDDDDDRHHSANVTIRLTKCSRSIAKRWANTAKLWTAPAVST
jgi:uncharacterized lipoprotein